MQYTHVEHGFAPIYNSESKILILGSMPSVQSRKNGFYYGNLQNRFWRVLAALLSCPVPDTVEEKTSMLLEHRIALWDVISSCDIAGSSDASIKNVIPADLQSVLNESDYLGNLCQRQNSRENIPQIPAACDGQGYSASSVNQRRQRVMEPTAPYITLERAYQYGLSMLSAFLTASSRSIS